MKIRDRIVEFKRVLASELLPNPKNWRVHPPAQKGALQGILAEVGYADALLARETDAGLMLIDGHLRAETTPDTEVPVLVVDLDEQEADKLLAVLDPLAGLATRNNDALTALVSGISSGNKALQGLLDNLLAQARAWSPVDPTPDEVVVPVSAPGDLWLLDQHRLLCGDATSEADVKRLLDGAVPFMMVSDPPFGVNYNPAWRDENSVVGRYGGLKSEKVKQRKSVANDDRIDWTAALTLFPGDVAYVWHDALHTAETESAFRATGIEPRAQIVWVKQTHIFTRGAYSWQHEACLYGVRKGKKSRWHGDRTQSTVWAIESMHPIGKSEPMEHKWGHGTQKPLECMARPIKNHGTKDDDVYDPFVGSGTTIAAAEQLGRRCFAMDIDPVCVDMAVRRWEKLTGKRASIEAGKTMPEIEHVGSNVG